MQDDVAVFLGDKAPWAIRIANWPFNSVKGDQKHWDGNDWAMIMLKWPVSCFGLAFTVSCCRTYWRVLY